MTRKKIPVTPILSLDESKELADTVARLATEVQTLTARRNAAQERILDNYNSRIDDREQRIAAILPRLELYSGMHPEIFPKDRRTTESPLAIFGFRLGQPKVEKRAEEKEEAVAVCLHIAKHDEVVTIKYSLNKDAILRMLQDPKVPAPAWLTKLFRVRQDDSFFVEPKAQEK